MANNARFCLLTAPGQYPNLASRALALNLARLAEDWRAAYGHPILLAESFVDTQLFRGTAYKAAGWQPGLPPADFPPPAAHALLPACREPENIQCQTGFIQ